MEYKARINFNDYYSSPLTFGKLEINPNTRQVFYDKEEKNLTAIEFNILYFMASYPGFVFTHRQLYEAVWEKEYVLDAGNVTAHIGHIRKKIEPNPNRPMYIQTVHGVGYRFVG